MPVTDFRAGADSSQAQLFFVKETTWGQVPAGPPKLNTARITSESLTLDKTTQRSNEISAGRKVRNRILTAFEVGGDIGFELSLDAPGSGGLADLFDGALFGAWSADLAIGPEAIDASAADNSFSDNPAAGAFAAVRVGQWIKAAGFTDPANNGIFQVISKPSDDKVAVDASLVTEAGSGDETVTGRMLRDGTTAHSYVFELLFGGITTPQYLGFLGNMFGRLAMSFETDAIVTGTLSVLGKDMNDPSAVSLGDGAPNPAGTGEVANTVTDVGFIREAGATPSAFIRTLDVTLDNGLRVQRAIGNGPGAAGIGLGDADVTGRLAAYFIDGSLIAKYKAHTPTQIDWRVTDAAGKALVITLPRVRLSSFGAPISGPNQDVEQAFDFEAEVDPATDATIQFDYFAT
jgi:hypothetical protein